jgi:hypothetical protein
VSIRRSNPIRVIDTLAATPDAGELIVGSGGCRKVRIAGKGRGKSAATGS